jgi:hypothetical protein
MKNRVKVLTIFIALISILPTNAFASGGGTTAETYLYYANAPSSILNIGRASIQSSDQTDNFIAGNSFGWYDGGLTIRGDYIYWTSNNSIVRANIDGTGSNETIYTSNTSGTSLSGITTYGDYLYWGDLGRKAIGRALLDGSSANADFLVGTSKDDTTNDTYGIFVNSNYIYWANFDSNSIGRANLDGTSKNNAFIQLPSGGPCAIFALGSKLIWTNFNTGTLGSSNLDGTNVNQSFISTTGTNPGPYYLVADSSDIYWTNFYTNSIGKASLDGTEVNYNYLTVTQPVGIWLVNPNSGSGGSSGSDSKSAEEIAAEVIAARAREVAKAKNEILGLVKLGKPINLSLLNSAEIYGGTEKSIVLINTDIAGLTKTEKEIISSVEKVVFKFLTIDRIARGERVYLPDLQNAGLVKADSIHKKSIPSALRRADLSQVSSFEGIQSYIAEVEKAINDRKAALLAARAKIKALLERWVGR